jgi:hypothetical protein
MTELIQNIKCLFQTGPKLSLHAVATPWMLVFFLSNSLGNKFANIFVMFGTALLAFPVAIFLNYLARKSIEGLTQTKSFGELPKFERAAAMGVVAAISVTLATVTAQLLGVGGTAHFYFFAVSMVIIVAGLVFMKEAN